MIDYTTIITLLVGLFSGGSVMWIFTLRSEKKKKAAEAYKEEVNVYQEIIKDLREDRKLMKEERDYYFQELKQLQEHHMELDRTVKDIEKEIKVLNGRLAREQCLKFECKERVVG
ncbi:MAG: hypothetical protein GX102_15445 [Porphyromonadaceae bacterium]|nr:hypothetical protein [Porphyromonadaceae bacterium]